MNRVRYSIFTNIRFTDKLHAKSRHEAKAARHQASWLSSPRSSRPSLQSPKLHLYQCIPYSPLNTDTRVLRHLSGKSPTSGTFGHPVPQRRWRTGNLFRSIRVQPTSKILRSRRQRLCRTEKYKVCLRLQNKLKAQ